MTIEKDRKFTISHQNVMTVSHCLKSIGRLIGQGDYGQASELTHLIDDLIHELWEEEESATVDVPRRVKRRAALKRAHKTA